MDVPELEWRPGGLVEEDHEERDDGQPELGGAQLAGAASEHLHQERPPGDEQQDHGDGVSQDGRGDVEEVGGGLLRRHRGQGAVHTHLQKMHNVNIV